VELAEPPPRLKPGLLAPARVLAIGAHPDDIELNCGGTLAKWAEAGSEIHHVVCTDGAKGTWDEGASADELIASRREEQRAASCALGAKGEIAFLGWPDGELDSGLRQRREMCHWIRALKPDVVMGHDPWKRYRLHPDHRHAGLLATDGIVAARDPHFFPGQAFPAHRPDALVLFEADVPNYAEDVSDFVERKITALLAHESQLRSTMGIDDPGSAEQLGAFRSRVRERLREAGEPFGLGAAEAFRLLRPL
jgi:LmbE family N-acetylglucosaminyl deacetylase